MNRLARWAFSGLAALLLAACQNPPPHRITVAAPARRVAPPESKTAATAIARNIDDYKMQVAGQILAANPAIIFSGRLPPMLPAIVVVDISVNRDGELASVEVKRSRDGEASKVALAAVKRVGAPFPKPQHLMLRGHKTLDFSETFLFDHQYHFQLRSLAGPQ
jgi:protein TonB